jgi:hypothetical protein
MTCSVSRKVIARPRLVYCAQRSRRCFWRSALRFHALPRKLQSAPLSSDPASPIAAHLRNPLIPVKSRVDWDLISPMLEEQLNRSPDKMSIPNVTVGEGSDQVSTVILQLDWSRGRTEILRAFGDLLSKMEAQDMKAQDPRGGGTELDHRAAELRALGGWRIKRFESSITDCKSYYNLYETIGAYYKAEEKAVKITRKYFVSVFSDKKAVLRP